jgi:hypothetical protein
VTCPEIHNDLPAVASVMAIGKIDLVLISAQISNIDQGCRKCNAYINLEHAGDKKAPVINGTWESRAFGIQLQSPPSHRANDVSQPLVGRLATYGVSLGQKGQRFNMYRSTIPLHIIHTHK